MTVDIFTSDNNTQATLSEVAKAFLGTIKELEQNSREASVGLGHHQYFSTGNDKYYILSGSGIGNLMALSANNVFRSYTPEELRGICLKTNEDFPTALPYGKKMNDSIVQESFNQIGKTVFDYQFFFDQDEKSIEEKNCILHWGNFFESLIITTGVGRNEAENVIFVNTLSLPIEKFPESVLESYNLPKNGFMVSGTPDVLAFTIPNLKKAWELRLSVYDAKTLRVPPWIKQIKANGTYAAPSHVLQVLWYYQILKAALENKEVTIFLNNRQVKKKLEVSLGNVQTWVMNLAEWYNSFTDFSKKSKGHDVDWVAMEKQLSGDLLFLRGISDVYKRCAAMKERFMKYEKYTHQGTDMEKIWNNFQVIKKDANLDAYEILLPGKNSPVSLKSCLDAYPLLPFGIYNLRHIEKLIKDRQGNDGLFEMQ
jgi:hypothetical protein